MPTFSVELDVTIKTKKRGYLGEYSKQKRYTKILTVSADNKEKAEALAIDRIKVQTPGYSLISVSVNSCEEKDESLKETTVTVTGKVYFGKSSEKEFKDVTLDYVYNRGKDVNDEMLTNHAESRFRNEVQEMDDFVYVDYIVSNIISEDLERYIQI